jgi:hypothetical protein
VIEANAPVSSLFYRGRGEKALVIDAGDESPPLCEREDRKKHVI